MKTEWGVKGLFANHLGLCLVLQALQAYYKHMAPSVLTMMFIGILHIWLEASWHGYTPITFA